MRTSATNHMSTLSRLTTWGVELLLGMIVLFVLLGALLISFCLGGPQRKRRIVGRGARSTTPDRYEYLDYESDLNVDYATNGRTMEFPTASPPR
jgi:hypothetical protein